MPRWPERVAIGDPEDPRGFELLVRRYLESRHMHNYSLRSRGSWESVLRTFGKWCEERGVTRPAEVTRSMLERYQRWLFYYRREDGRPLAVSTQRSRLCYLKGFFRWLVKERYLLYNPTSGIELPKEPVRLPIHGFSLQEVERVLATPDISTPLGIRDRAILETLYSTGIRRTEVATLDLYDLDFDRGWLTVRQGKGGKDRVVPIGERALAWIRRYLEEVRGDLVAHPDEWAVFVNAEGLRFSADGLGNRVAKMVAGSGVSVRYGSCHLFRHTMATLMLENGADVRFIQEILGHVSLDTTNIYTKVSIHKLKEIHSATHPAKLRQGQEEVEDAEAVLPAAEAEAAEPAKAGEPDVRRIRRWTPPRLRGR
jgi:integrase/recombinase XerD